ncbi:MAG: putative manganese transport protein MntH [Chloroflexi bacterium OLB14]|nr:MAG: putative manganese transport protein MntH [Chloroflexi bacterium OLB14]
MKKHTQNSLSEVHESVVVPTKSTSWKRWLAIMGPALMVSVGYMDPGNWATDIAGGSRYSYALIWVLLMSNIMAILLQSLAARLGIVSRRDLAQVCHEDYPPIVNIPLYILAEIAITACDLAEVIGSAIALDLLFGIPLFYGVILTALDTILLLLLSHAGIRKLESVVIALVGTIGVAFFIEILLGKPDWGGIVRGFMPTLPDSNALYIAIGILGATVMPHNLYLHSSLVQTRKIGRDSEEIKKTLRWNTIDTTLSLNIAFLINAAILVMAASVFHKNGYFGVAEIQDAHRLLEPLLGASIAPIAFAIALLASGQSSTITGTLAGQIVMEGYLNLRIRPWLRRLITRLLAVVPAILVIAYYGEDSTGAMLVLSQVVLSLQLPFAIIPLINSVANKKRMGEFAIGRKIQILAWIVAGIILSLNIKLIIDQIGTWIAEAGANAWLVEITVIPLTLGLAVLLLYVIFHPWMQKQNEIRTGSVHRQATGEITTLQPPEPYKRVAVALDFSGKDEKLLAESLRFIDKAQTQLTLLHIVESPVARRLGTEGEDLETLADSERLEKLSQMMIDNNVKTEWKIGSGEPGKELAKLINESDIEIVIVGGHGHSGVSDLIHGTVISDLRHHIKANVLIVPISD